MSERDNMGASQSLSRRERVKTGGGAGMGLSHPLLLPLIIFLSSSPLQVFFCGLSPLPWGGSGGCWVHFGLSYCFNFGAGSLVPGSR